MRGKSILNLFINKGFIHFLGFSFRKCEGLYKENKLYLQLVMSTLHFGIYKMFQNVKWFALCAFSCIWVYSGDILEALKPSLEIHHHLSMIFKRRIYAPSVAATWVYVQRSWNIVAEQLGVVAHAVGRHNHMVVVG